FIVDKIAEKLNVATDKIQPIAEETLRQYQVREFFYANCGFGFATFLLIISIIIFILGFRTPDKDSCSIAIIPLIIMFICLIFAINAYGRYLAPIPSIFGF
ncbi:MAG: hypothetical protein AABY22_07145, partial [Nanoarchaeota archaeon]